jgi:ketosteroid isomerase-like protein
MNRFICIAVLIYFPFLLAPGQEKIDEAEILMRLDREFDKTTAERGVDGWVAYFAPNGSMIGDTSRPTTGPVEIRKAMEPLFKDSTFSLRWQPTKAEMLIPGVLGYTIGRYVRLKRNKEGKLMKWTGSYSTIWKKQPGGTWKIILDTGESDGSPEEMKNQTN